MRFHQNNSLSGYRENIILAALLDFDQLMRLRSSSQALSGALVMLDDQGQALDVINQLAYSAISRFVPSPFDDAAEAEFIDMPITADELQTVLNRPIGSTMRMPKLKEQ